MSRPSARSGSGDGEGFLGRWSERKLKARTPAEEADPIASPRPDAALPAAAPAGAEAPPKTEAEILAELGLPDPDTLAKGDDFAGFMKAAVPAALRNRALRRLWLTDPVLANVDGLNDYDGDFTDAATGVKGVLKTAYKVGRGYLRDEPEPDPEAAADADAADAAADADADAGGRSGGDDAAHGPAHAAEDSAEAAGPSGAGEAGPTPPEAVPATTAHGPAADATAEAATGTGAPPDPARPEADPPPARRMRFSFDG